MGPGAESLDFPGVEGMEGIAPNGSPICGTCDAPVATAWRQEGRPQNGEKFGKVAKSKFLNMGEFSFQKSKLSNRELRIAI